MSPGEPGSQDIVLEMELKREGGEADLSGT